MKIGLIVTTYNRASYLKECLESLSRADMPEGTRVIIADDNSDKETTDLIQLYCGNNEWFWRKNTLPKGIKNNIIDNIQCFQNKNEPHSFDVDLIINLDGDALVRTDFIHRLLNLHCEFPEHLVSGFECTNLNEDGTPRHKIEHDGGHYKVRKTVGGINLCFTPEMYQNWILPALLEPVGNWDQSACLRAGNGVVCASPSLIQHIGLESSMGHSSSAGTMADVSDTFCPLSLPDVTLIGVDSNYPRLEKAIEESCKDIYFGDVQAINLTAITSKEMYSDYCIKHLYKHVKTSHLLVIQWDGYVKNWKAWDKSWLQYDYIGAPWEWYTDGHQVGNGGFSLRSKRLMEIVATDPIFQTNNHPEDHVICRTHRKHLEEKYGIKFAPIEVARKFSIEGYRSWNKTHTTEFGFHSSAVKFTTNNELPGTGKTAYIQQYFGIGDVIFSMQIARNLIKQGYKVCWPVLPDYVEQLNRAYPDITFIDMWLTQAKFMENKEMVLRGSTFYVPLRWTYDLLKVPFKDCMRSKYDFMQMDWTTWSEAMYDRNLSREKALMAELGIKEGEPYILVNRMFRSDNKGKAQFPIPAGKVVEMTMRPNFSLFDWSMIIENATEIHTVSTSIVYLFELLELKAEKVFIYIREPQEKNHDNYSYILQRHKDKYILC